MRVSYYDVVLGLIPLALIGVSGALYSAGIDLTTAVPIGGLFAVLLVGHALFINAPCEVELESNTIETTEQPAEKSIPEPVEDVAEKQQQQNQLQ